MIKLAGSALAVLSLAACGWNETAGDFTYMCASGLYGVDAPSCSVQLTDRYLLRYGEGSGDNVVLAFGFGGNGSSGLINAMKEGDVVEKLGLDGRLLVAQTRGGEFFVAPAHTDHFPDVVGPLNAQEFAARYPDAPELKRVQ